MHTISLLTVTPFEQGFLNLGTQYIDLVGNHLEIININLDDKREPIQGTLYRQNPPNNQRIRNGVEMHEWFEANCQIGQYLNVSIFNPVTFWIYI